MGPGLWRGLIFRDSDLKATHMSLRIKFVGVEDLIKQINGKEMPIYRGSA